MDFLLDPLFVEVDMLSFSPLLYDPDPVEFARPDPAPWLDTTSGDDLVSSGTTTFLEWRAAAVRGVAHRHFGTSRQDNLAVAANPSGEAVVIAVADGLGSCRYSQYGSAAAVGAAVHEVVTLVDPLGFDAGAVVQVAADAVRSFASRLDLPPESYFTTLTVAVVEYVDGALVGRIAVVGDCAAYEVRGQDGSVSERLVLLAPQGDAGSSPTNIVASCLPDHLGVEEAEFCLPPTSALLICSDGIAAPAGAGDTPFARHLAEQWSAGPPAPLRFAADAAVECVGALDDRSAVVVWAKEG